MGGMLTLVLVAAGLVAALSGLAALAGRAPPRIGALAALAAGGLLAAVPWLLPAAVVEAPGAVMLPAVVATKANRVVLNTARPEPLPALPGRPAARIDIEARELEPNDSIAGANVARLGTAVQGELGPGDVDWIAVDVPAGAQGRLVATVTTEAASVTMTLHDDAGQTLGTAATIDEVRVRSATLDRLIDAPRYHVRLSPNGDAAARYQLTLAARR